MRRVSSETGSYLLRSLLDPLRSILIRDPTANLKSSQPRSQRLLRSLCVPGAQHDHMRALQLIFAVQLCKVRRRMRRDEVGLEGGRVLRIQRPADDLLDLPSMQVYTRAEDSHLGMRSEEMKSLMWVGMVEDPMLKFW